MIFLTVPAHGHLNSILGVVKELTNRGHHIIIYSTDEFAEKITQAGAEFRPPPIPLEKIDLRIATNGLKVAEMSLYLTKLLLPALIIAIQQEKPDCLVHDALAMWGKVAGIKTGIPTISLVTSMGINTQVILAYSKFLISDYLQLIAHPVKSITLINDYRSLYKNLHVSPPHVFDWFTNKEKLNIVFTSEYFQALREGFDSSFKFVGPIIYERSEQAITLLPKTKKPIIYISLGTIYNDRLDLYKTFIRTFKETDYEIFISIGKHIKPADLGKIPENIHIAAYLPQLEILKKASLFISHGGMNSVNESLYFRVPMLLFPQIQEQKANSFRVEELGAGIYYRKNKVTEKELIKLVNQILDDNSFKQNAEKIQKTLVEAGGSKKAVKYILDYIG